MNRSVFGAHRSGTGVCTAERRVRGAVCAGARMGQSDDAPDVWNSGPDSRPDLTLDRSAGDGGPADSRLRAESVFEILAEATSKVEVCAGDQPTPFLH